MIKPKYIKSDYIAFKFSEPPSTSCQDVIGLRFNDTSKDINFPNKRFTFTKKIDDGSASTIHLGHDTLRDVDVVIKKINKRDHWLKELTILKNFTDSKSGKIIKFIDHFESQKNSYIVTEYYNGFDLFSHIDINVPYPEKMAYSVLLEMCNCIKECHDRGIVHLDIKCENFMTRSNKLFDTDNTIIPNNLVLIDFGHAQYLQNNEKIEDLREGSKYGTTLYVCPEGYDRIFSSKSDIWSLGICLAMLLTGEFPFNGDEKEYMTNAYHHNIDLVMDVSKKSELIISMCLQVDPTKRPTIDQLIKMLK